MRHILVDYARARHAKKRPDARLQLSLSDVDVAAGEHRRGPPRARRGAVATRDGRTARVPRRGASLFHRTLRARGGGSDGDLGRDPQARLAVRESVALRPASRRSFFIVREESAGSVEPCVSSRELFSSRFSPVPSGRVTGLDPVAWTVSLRSCLSCGRDAAGAWRRSTRRSASSSFTAPPRGSLQVSSPPPPPRLPLLEHLPPRACIVTTHSSTRSAVDEAPHDGSASRPMPIFHPSQKSRVRGCFSGPSCAVRSHVA